MMTARGRRVSRKNSLVVSKPAVVIENQHIQGADRARDGCFEVVPCWFAIENYAGRIAAREVAEYDPATGDYVSDGQFKLRYHKKCDGSTEVAE
jgi:hypothetical protein